MENYIVWVHHGGRCTSTETCNQEVIGNEEVGLRMRFKRSSPVPLMSQ